MATRMKLTRDELVERMRMLENQNIAMSVAYACGDACYSAGIGEIHIKHFAAWRADGGAVLVQWGHKAFPEAMFGCDFDRYVERAKLSANTRQAYEEVDWWNQVDEHVRANMREAFATWRDPIAVSA